MARIDNVTNFLTDVADSIRTKTGKTEPILASEFDTEIENIAGEEDLDAELTVYDEELTEQEDTLATILNVLESKNNSSGGDGEMIKYSTEETNTGKTWIDSKPIYRKVGTITFSAVYESGAYTKGDYISGDIEHITITEIFNDAIGSGATFYTASNLATEIYVDNGANSANKGYIMGFTKNSGFLNSPYYVVVEYTKTTD